MLLYKNVDICDLKSIMENGILSMDECGNDNWNEGKRAENDTSVVYLFSPIGKHNSFPNYGAALLEVQCEAKENKIGKTDIHIDDYMEYITKRVKPSEIKRVIIPKIFKDYISVPQNVGIKWCELKAECYGNNGLEECSNKILEQFAKTALLMDSTDFNFFRGVTEKRTMIDLYNIEYIF